MKKTSIWGSISLLTGIVIAILALVRGPWLIPLLIGVCAAWGLWFLLTQIRPHRRTKKVKQQQEQTESLNRRLAQTLLHHVNYRVSACLHTSYPDARWQWMMRDPALFVAQGGTGRIRVYGIDGYEFADVTVDQNGKLACSLIKLSPMDETRGSETPEQQAQDPQIWYDAQGRQTLRYLVDDLNSRGHSRLTLKEDGSCVCEELDGSEVKQGTLGDFPAKDCWPKLAEALERDGLTATVEADRIIVVW